MKRIGLEYILLLVAACCLWLGSHHDANNSLKQAHHQDATLQAALVNQELQALDIGLHIAAAMSSSPSLPLEALLNQGQGKLQQPAWHRFKPLMQPLPVTVSTQFKHDFPFLTTHVIAVHQPRQLQSPVLCEWIAPSATSTSSAAEQLCGGASGAVSPQGPASVPVSQAAMHGMNATALYLHLQHHTAASVRYFLSSDASRLGAVFPVQHVDDHALFFWVNVDLQSLPSHACREVIAATPLAVHLVPSNVPSSTSPSSSLTLTELVTAAPIEREEEFTSDSNMQLPVLAAFGVVAIAVVAYFLFPLLWPRFAETSPYYQKYHELEKALKVSKQTPRSLPVLAEA